MKAFVSWSGGKETALSCYRAMRNRDIQVAYLLNMISENGKRSRTHGISSKLLRSQAQAMGIPIVQRQTTWETYEREFKKAVSDLRKKGIRAGIFGDIDLREHRDWVERVSEESGIKPIFPLWKMEREEILAELICSGFQAIVVAAKADLLDSKWIARKIDREFINDLKKIAEVDLCGEAGEYHTFVTAGPIFQKKINILKTEKSKRNKHWYLEVLDYEVIPKF